MTTMLRAAGVLKGTRTKDEAEVRSQLIQDMLQHGGESTFVRVGNNTYGLRYHPAETPISPFRKAAPQSPPSRENPQPPPPRGRLRGGTSEVSARAMPDASEQSDHDTPANRRHELPTSADDGRAPTSSPRIPPFAPPARQLNACS